MQNLCYSILNWAAGLAHESPIALGGAIVRLPLTLLVLHDDIIITLRLTCAVRSLHRSLPGTERLALRFFRGHQILNPPCQGASSPCSLFLATVNLSTARWSWRIVLCQKFSFAFWSLRLAFHESRWASQANLKFWRCDTVYIRCDNQTFTTLLKFLITDLIMI